MPLLCSARVIRSSRSHNTPRVRETRLSHLYQYTHCTRRSDFLISLLFQNTLWNCARLENQARERERGFISLFLHTCCFVASLLLWSRQFYRLFAQRVSANLNAAHYLHHWCFINAARHSLGLALRKLHQTDEINSPPASQPNNELWFAPLFMHLHSPRIILINFYFSLLEWKKRKIKKEFYFKEILQLTWFILLFF